MCLTLMRGRGGSFFGMMGFNNNNNIDGLGGTILRDPQHFSSQTLRYMDQKLLASATFLRYNSSFAKLGSLGMW